MLIENGIYRICFRNQDGLQCVLLTRQPTAAMLQAHDLELAESAHDLNVVNTFNGSNV